MKPGLSKTIGDTPKTSTGDARGSASIQQSKVVEEEKSQQDNLLNGASKHLFELMKIIAPTDKKDQEDVRVREPNVRMSTQQVQAACSCAKNIREIIKLQRDA